MQRNSDHFNQIWSILFADQFSYDIVDRTTAWSQWSLWKSFLKYKNACISDYISNVWQTSITVKSQGRHGVSNYEQLDCLFTSFFRLTAVKPRLHFIGFIEISMMTSWNGNTFRVTGPFCAGNLPVTGDIPRTNVSDAELWCFLWSAPEQTVE